MLNDQTLIHFTFPAKIYLKPITFASQEKKRKYLNARMNEQVGSLAKTPKSGSELLET